MAVSIAVSDGEDAHLVYKIVEEKERGRHVCRKEAFR